MMRTMFLLPVPVLLALSLPALGQEPATETTQEPAQETAQETAQDTAQDTAQENAAPAPAGPEDWEKWERLGSTTLSPDGRWLAYEVRRVDGSFDLHLRVLATDSTEVFENGSRPTFSKDGAWLAYSIGHSEAEREKLTKQKKPVENDMGLFDLITGTRSEVERVSSFSFSEDGHFLLVRHSPQKDQKGGADVVVRNLTRGQDTHFGRVGSTSWSEVGSLLAMTIDAPEKAGNGVAVYDAASGNLRTLDSDGSSYKSLVWREDAADLAVMRERAFEDDEDVTHAVLAWRGLDGREPRSTSYDHFDDETFPDELRVVDYAGLRWSDDGGRLFFGLKTWEDRPAELDEDESEDEETEESGEAVSEDAVSEDAAPAKDDESEDAEEESEGGKTLQESLDEAPGVEVWHAADIDIIPRQKKTLSRDERRSFLAALDLEQGPHGHLVQLANEEVDSVTLLEGERWALGSDDTPYEEEQRFSATYVDLYAIDVASGTQTKVLVRVKYRYTGDPRGTRFLFVRDDHIWVHDLQTGARHNLTAGVDTPFINQENSSLTDEKPPYGITGWTEDGRHVILNSRYDLWAAALDGSGMQRLTHGSDLQIRHRRLVLDREQEEFIDPAEPFYVSLYGDTTKRSGFGRVGLRSNAEHLVYEDARLSRLTRAKDAAVLTYVRERYDDSPDVFVTGANLDGGRQVTGTNAFQSDYLWGHSELIDYQSANGVALQGALFYPADYDPSRTYPMIVYIYELRSQTLHSYTLPSERDPYNTSVFTSQGYFVYQPDIVYRAQNPGLSAVECVIPAVRRVLQTGLIDKDRVGLVGHSWGAYQTAFLVTQTDIFAAGVAGAPLTNMMSMSMSIYWNSGQTDAYIFHESQGRMDRPFWNDVDTYIANSPIFNIEDMNTPLLMTFGDKDGAVDWHQGVEMYNAARLAGKPLVMLVYPGENHGLRQKPNRVDYHHRVRAWFDHYLKGDPAPTWITEGQTWLERKRELEDFEKAKKSKQPSKGK